ncbi:flagellar hook-length control protein FliK [Sphingomonas sp. Leaf4]|uniref:flagellar hook-length control protein FliK n=1 Tax=Sphingomonas sp. Leaf4 TaxID=2876553 RepID=UPI001E4A2518|nr:flagellar hook-length control protein FliK [Sphingomonas sp. Leaf4]
MQPLSPLERSIAPPGRHARRDAGDDAFAALLAGVGEAAGDDVRQPAAPPGGKRLPEGAPDPALLLAGLIPPPVVPVTPPVVETPPAAVAGTAPVPPSPPGIAPPPAAPGVSPVAETIDGLPLAPPPAEGAPPPAMAEGKTLPAAASDLPVAPRHRMAGEASAPVVPIAPPAPPVPVQVAHAAPALLADALPEERDSATPRDGDVAMPWSIAGMAEAVPRPIAAPAAADDARLDLRDDRWMQGMIDHIETLQGEQAGTGETRIRLSPDALGTVEIVLSHGEDGVAVRFASDTADAGRLLADAQPRLAEMAAQRGLKLGGMQVDVGSRQGEPRHDPPPAPRRPQPFSGAQSPDPVTDDLRIA